MSIWSQLPFLIALGALGHGCGTNTAGQTRTPQTQNKPVVVAPCVATNDTEINAAMETARRTFPEFWSEVLSDRQRPASTLQVAMVKAHFSDTGPPVAEEMMWVGNAQFDGTNISGILANSPLKVKTLHQGQQVSFPLEQLADWFFVKDGKLVGGFTERILRSRLSEEERRIYDSKHSYTFQ